MEKLNIFKFVSDFIETLKSFFGVKKVMKMDNQKKPHTKLPSDDNSEDEDQEEKKLITAEEWRFTYFRNPYSINF